jgi:hypothetical protein
MGWRNLFSFPVVLLCQFSVLAGYRLWFYILLMYLEYHKVVVLCLVFLVLAGNSFWCFVHMVLIIQYSCAVVSVSCSGRKSVLVWHTYVLRVQYNCDVLLVFWSWWEIIIDFTYVFSAQYSFGVVSVFLLWREIVLKMRTYFYKESYWVTLIWSDSQCVYL